MAKKESTFLNMTVIMFVVAVIASAALAGVYVLTEEPIKTAKEKNLKDAINVVVPGADKATDINSFSKISLDLENADSLYFYIVKNEGKILGTAVKTYTNNGFGGRIDIMVGFDENGKIIDSDVLEHHETPGLGNKTAKSVTNWNEQFKNESKNNPQEENFKVNKEGGNIDAITAATISSRAYIDALKRASDAYEKYIKNEKMEETNNE